ncbi:MAG: hypothetical protein KGD58_11205 [Candidatus Lokiarchaeota archaeon]|nr:hypothetical protein [Candidatus Lokiarchaeota archaeon]
MLTEIYQVNWVLIDVVIIFLLFLLLISVKFFKSSHRWRLKFSNEALENYPLPKSYNDGTGRFLDIKHCSLTRNSSLYKEYQDIPIIFMIRTKFKKRLTKIITEGLSCYGFNIINLKLKINSRTKISNGLIDDEMNSLIYSVIGYCNREAIISIPRYILINYSKFFISAEKILSDPMNDGLLCINPRITKHKIRNMEDIFDDNPQYPQIFYIFSRRNLFLLKNPNLKCFINEFAEITTSKVELITLEKSTRNFKYYETILLGIIIDIIENKLLKS